MASSISPVRIAIIGAGAAGCFCAVELSRLLPKAKIDIYEAGNRPLAKVAVTGGGRCNLTNSFEGISDLAEAYPRGFRLMKRLFSDFGWRGTWEWFENQGVRLVLQDDHCVFPASQDAMQIVRTLSRLMSSNGVNTHTGCKVNGIFASSPDGKGRQFKIEYDGGSTEADYAVVTTGGSPKSGGLSFLAPLGLDIVEPVPSLFTFSIPDNPVTSLMGLTVPEATCSIAGTNFKSAGTVLITDWGMSGPAILKLSSYSARYLKENNYKATLCINWCSLSREDCEALIHRASATNPQKMISGSSPFGLPSRLWQHITAKAGLREDMRWAELGRKGLNKLTETLVCDTYPISGKSRFREEFVTCGGVSLKEITPAMESKKHSGLFFAGEVLDIDAITGGFNLQAAWTTGWTAARSIAASEQSLK